MRWEAIGTLTCPIAQSLSVVGDRWTLLILRDAFLGARRFDHLQTSLRCSPHVLSTRLAKLVRHGVLERRPYQRKPTRYEYRLTEKGLDLYPVIIGLRGWGDRWFGDGHDTPVRLFHKRCGHETTPALTCSACGERLDARAVRPLLDTEERDHP